MEIAGVVERVERIASVRANPAADTALIHTGPVAIREVQAWCHAVVVRNGVVLYAPGEPNLGRNTRLANRAQRSALRGLYRSCAIPGGTTDLNNPILFKYVPPRLPHPPLDCERQPSLSSACSPVVRRHGSQRDWHSRAA